jgi:predicted regulator of Ras-like GTPase activity (Roadblock/LC7/MglB family)
MLQFLIFANKRVKVEVFNPLGKKGEFGLDGDEILWIRCGSKEGEEAFYDIMSWESGTFEVLPLDKDTKPSEMEKLPVPLSFLLFEAARRKDEAAVPIDEEQEAPIPNHEDVGTIDIDKELAAWQTEVAGFVESALINMDGTCIAGTSTFPGQDLSMPVAYCAKAVKAIVDNLHVNKRGNWHEVLISTDTHHMLCHKFTNDIFLTLTVTIDEGNLGMSRLQMEQLRKKVSKELDLDVHH